MKKILAVLAVFTMMVFVISCGGSNNKSSDNGNDYDNNNNDNGGSNSDGENGLATEEGIYFGIIGFNEFQYTKDIGLLNQSNVSSYKSFIDSLTAKDGTGLYFADYTALEMMRNHQTPPKLQNVALVTFTDGLDNVSLNDEYNPGNYSSTDAYRDAIHNMIVNEKIHEHSVAAYSIGLKGKDVTDDAKFDKTLKSLASKDSNVFQVSDMDEVKESFAAIAQALYSVSKTEKLDVKVPGGYDDGQLLRFTFDNPDAATDSNLYIEATFRRSNGRTLENIKYKGFAKGETSISSDDKDGAYYHFVFVGLKYADGSTPDTNNIMLWKATSTGGWDRESEFNPATSTIVKEDKNSALIVLVLDCTTSLGSDFSRMQQAAKEFISTLVTGNSSNDNDGDNNSNESSNNNEQPESKCGNHIVDEGEVCDGSAQECSVVDPKYYDGFAECNTDCTGWDTTGCTEYSCTSVGGYLWSSKSPYAFDNGWTAQDYCETLSECGFSDWRFPTISELRLLIQNCAYTEVNGSCPVSDYCIDCGDETCEYCDTYSDGRYSKLGDTEQFWSASHYEPGANTFWVVYFNNGHIEKGHNCYKCEFYVRCIR